MSQVVCKSALNICSVSNRILIQTYLPLCFPSIKKKDSPSSAKDIKYNLEYLIRLPPLNYVSIFEVG